jgi:hypothetical protein
MADPSVTERSYPFSSGPGEFVTEDDWAAMAAPFQDDGVIGHPGTDDLTIVPGTAPNTIQINVGDLKIGGYHYRLTAPKTLNTVANAGTTPRVDLVVAELDLANKAIVTKVFPGTPLSAIGPGRVPLGQWTQPPATEVTPTFWGTATDRRWFAGARTRPMVDGSMPPATAGGFCYDDDGTGHGTVYIGVLDDEGDPYWTPWLPLSPERMDPVEAEHNVDLTTTSTAWVAGTPQVGVTFTAPPSGRVTVTVYSQLECEAPGYAFCGFEIRLNNASGAVVTPASQDVAAAQQEDKFSASGRRKLVSGLTPGQQYYARTMHRTSASIYTATIFHRAILVEPVYTEVTPGTPPDPTPPLEGAVLTAGGSIIRTPDGDLNTSALRIRIPAGDRSSAVESFGMYLNVGTDEAPVWARKSFFDSYGNLCLIPSTGGFSPLVVQADPAQSVDLVRIQNSSATPVAGFKADGKIYAPNFTAVLVLGPSDPIPAGTEAGTVILRTA